MRREKTEKPWKEEKMPPVLTYGSSPTRSRRTTAGETAIKYQPGDRVGLAVIDFDHDFGPYTGEYRPGVVNKATDAGYCAACHCQPTNPDHHVGGSVCCPGPFYEVLTREPWADEDDENAQLVKVHVPEHDLIPGGRADAA